MEFRQIDIILDSARIRCFNPCFSGYGIQTIKQTPSQSKKWGFNPCFSGYGIQTISQSFNDHHICKFQSLFFWIWNSDAGSGRRYIYHILVSILVFLDMEFRRCCGDSKCAGLCVSILVFLDMEFRHGAQMADEWLLVGFQSLFFWIWNSDLTYSPCRANELRVSILVFLDMEFRRDFSLAILDSGICFNPCFSGYGIQTPTITGFGQA